MNSSPRTLLIIDDSPEDRELYRRYLLRDQDYSYTILEASLGRQGLDLWHQHQPDAVLLDYRLPDLDGLEFLAQLPSSLPQPCWPVIMVTGQGNEAIAVQAIKAGAQDYLVKGEITPEGLYLAVKGAIETVQLRTQLQQRIARERLVAQMTQKLHQSLDLEEILQTTVTEVRRFLQTDRVLVFRLRPEGWGTVTTESVGAEWTPLLSTSLYDPCFNENYAKFFRQGAVTAKPDIHDGSLEPCHRELLARLQVQANLVVPILQDHQLWGMLIAHHCAAPRQWQPLEIDLLQELATQVGIALQQAELYQQAQQELAERQQTEAALRESQVLFEAFMRYSPATAYIKDEAGRYLYVNPLNEQICNRSIADWLGKTDFDLFSPQEAQQWWQNDQTALATNQMIQVEETHHQADGEHCFLSLKFPLQLSPERRLVAGLSLDISDRKRAEEALQANEARFKLALETTGTIYWERDLATNQLLLSGSFTHPAEAQPILYQEALMRVHPEDREQVQQANETAIARQGSFEIEHRLREPNDPDWRWVLARGKVLVNAAGVPTQIVGVSIDITDRKRAELNQQFLSDLDWQLRQQTDAEVMAWEVVSRLGTYLQVDRCLWHEVDWSQRSAIVKRTWHSPEVTDITGTYALDEFITAEQLHLFEAGQTLIVNDVTTHPSTAPYAQNYLYLGVATFVSVPYIYSGRWVAVLAVNSRTPRLWRSDEVALLQDIVARLWSLIEQTRSLQALRESEQQLWLAKEAAALGIHDYDITSGAIQWDARVRELWGVGAEEPITYEVFVSGLHPQDRAATQAAVDRALDPSGDGSYDAEYRVIHRTDGITRWIAATGIVFFEHGRAVRLVGTVQDITARKLAEQEAQAGKQILDALMDYVPEGITIADAPDVTIRRVSRYGQQLAGRSPEVIEGIPVKEHAENWGIFYPDGITPASNEVLPLTRAVQQGEVVTDEEWVLQRPDGTKITVLCNAGPIYVNDEITGGVIAWRDISDRVQFERDRERILQQEQAARAEAERANRIKDEFLAVLSHELRSPLNPILGWAKLLQTRTFDVVKTTAALATIERNAKIQTQLIDDLLDVAKILRGKLSMEANPVNLVFVIEAAIDTVRAAAIAKSILLHPVLPQIGQVSGDATRLQQIIWNLLSNAVKFTPNNGRVDIRLEQVGDQAQITVRDTGKGINPDFLPHIFESFRQEDASTTRKFGGLGLGLAIVRALVEAHGGTISANSQGEGLGATFTIQLPLLKVEPISGQPGQLPEQELDLTGIRVLAVDDDLDTRELLAALLTQSRAEVLTVASAAEVLAHLESFQPDVLISDIGMPEVDGYALIQQVRVLPSNKGGQVPAIALTAYAREEDYQQAIASGYQRHLTKPLDLDQLVQVVVELTRHTTFVSKGLAGIGSLDLGAD